WKYFGSSLDHLRDGYTCNSDGACIPARASTLKCASCHVGAPHAFREMDTNHDWDTRFSPLPGAAQLTASFAHVFGVPGREGAQVDAGAADTAWRTVRVAALRALGVRELLRPLFCTVDVGLSARAQVATIQPFDAVSTELVQNPRSMALSILPIDV